MRPYMGALCSLTASSFSESFSSQFYSSLPSLGIEPSLLLFFKIVPRFRIIALSFIVRPFFYLLFPTKYYVMSPRRLPTTESGCSYSGIVFLSHHELIFRQSKATPSIPQYHSANVWYHSPLYLTVIDDRIISNLSFRNPYHGIVVSKDEKYAPFTHDVILIFFIREGSRNN